MAYAVDADNVFIKANTVKLFVSSVDLPAELPLARQTRRIKKIKRKKTRGMYD